MDVNFELYKTFYTVAKIGNITKAAKQMCISQPGISKSIKNLEEQVNCRLFIRSKAGVTLTEEGKLLYDNIKMAIQLIENAEDKLLDYTSSDCGVVNIGISKTLTESFLLPYLEVFHEKYPNIKINIHTDFSNILINKVRNGLVDFIIGNLPYSMPQDFYVDELVEVSDCFIVGSKYKNLANKKIHLSELNEHPLILPAVGSVLRYNLDSYCDTLKIKLIPKIEIASHSLVREFSKIGFGIGIATYDFIKDELNSKKLYKLNIVEELPKRHIGISYLKDNYLSNTSRKFIDILYSNKN